MFEIIFLVFLSGYFIQSVLFVIGANKKFKKLKDEELLTASVIVAARNEEKNILRTLQSLDSLLYPDNKLEIIIVDDASEDNTKKIVEDFIANKKRFKLLSLEPYREGKLKGKTRAIAEALKIATGKIILTTDADCLVKPSWAKTIASYYTENVAMVNSYTTQDVQNSFSGMQAIDFIYLLLAAGGTINLNKPISCIGNNMSYIKKAYEEVGGYEKLPFSVTEDFILLAGINNLGKYKIIFPLDENILNTSLPCKNITELIRQKKRWAVGGLGVPPIGFAIMFWGFFTNLCILLTPLFFSPVWLYLAFFKVVIDFFVLYPIHKKLGIEKNLKYFLVYQLYYLIYVVMLPFIVFVSRKVKWKGREY